MDDDLGLCVGKEEAPTWAEQWEVLGVWMMSGLGSFGEQALPVQIRDEVGR